MANLSTESGRVLIFGGTGSLGQELCGYYDRAGVQLRIFSTDPHKQVALENRLLRQDHQFILGDIRDYQAVRRACEGVMYVIHAAALKHVHLGEKNIDEFLRVNVDGTVNVARAAQRACVPTALFISSDKACEPINFYGKTKALGEDIFLDHGYSALRYGNVVNSRGSFLHVWKNSVQNKQPITVRIPDPTRFYLELDHAIQLVDDALDVEQMSLNTIYVPHNLKAFWISSVLKHFPDAQVRNEPLMPGEKQHEVLLAGYEKAEQVSDLLWSVRKGVSDKVDHGMFCSKTAEQMTQQEIAAFVQRTLGDA